MSSCSLCNIIGKEEILFENNLVFVVKTKYDKGHKIRIMSVTKKHTTTPTFLEQTMLYFSLYYCMSKIMIDKQWVIVDSTFGTVKDHTHIVACDMESCDEEEIEQLSKTPKIRFPFSRVLIGIPTHNEEKHIFDVVTQVKKFGTVYVLNNASTDDTEAEAKKAGAIVSTHEWSGYGHAIYEIFSYAKENGYDILITLDGDGQHNPNEIPRFLTALQTSDIVTGNRFLSGEKVPQYRKAVISSLNIIYRIGDTQCGFRAYNRKAIESIKITDDGMGASLEILNIAREKSLRISEVPCAITYNEPEKPINNLLSHGLNLINTVFWSGIWARPYTFLAIPALILFIISSITGIQAILLYMSQGRLVGSLALICGITLLSSIALMSITFFITIQRRVIKELSRR